jgi:hypothetical protein
MQYHKGTAVGTTMASTGSLERIALFVASKTMRRNVNYFSIASSMFPVQAWRDSAAKQTLVK